MLIRDYNMIESDWVKNVVIIGAGGFGRECAAIVHRIELSSREVRLIGYIDDNKDIHGKILNGDKILGGLDYIDKWNDTTDKIPLYFICSLGDPKVKRQLVERALEKGYLPVNLIDPEAVVLSNDIGKGVVIQPNACIAVNVKIEDHVHVNFLCSIGHDVHLGKYTTISPLCAISGYTDIEEGCFLGSQVVTFTGMKIGKWSKIGANSTVTKNILEYTLNIGNPTKIIKRLD